MKHAWRREVLLRQHNVSKGCRGASGARFQSANCSFDRAFPADTPDAEWISTLSAEEDWIIISGDVRTSRNPGERAAWLESRLLAFFLAKGWTNQPLWEQAWRFVKWWPRIVEQAAWMKPPAGFIVPLKDSKLDKFELNPGHYQPRSRLARAMISSTTVVLASA